MLEMSGAIRGGDKKTVFSDMLEAGMVMLHLDARRIGVEVPPALSVDHHLRLNFSYRFHLEHFEVTKNGIEASLSFSGVPHACEVPWSAVFAMTSHASGEWRIWAEDLPDEVVERAAALTADDDPTDLAGELELDENLEPAPGPAVRRVGHLRVIK
ncbi:MAG: stringent starvation protein B [Myxococcota bacterium]|jgi:stringent starvation protein B